MATKYTEEETKELNNELIKLQTKAKQLILSDYYDHVRLNELQYSILTRLTNAKTHSDINYYMWNSGVMETMLEYISKKIKEARKQYEK